MKLFDAFRLRKNKLNNGLENRRGIPIRYYLLFPLLIFFILSSLLFIGLGHRSSLNTVELSQRSLAEEIVAGVEISVRNYFETVRSLAEINNALFRAGNLEQLNHAILEGNFEGIGETAHQIKGATSNLACSVLLGLAGAIEELAVKDMNLLLIKEKYEELQVEWEIVKALLEE